MKCVNKKRPRGARQKGRTIMGRMWRSISGVGTKDIWSRDTRAFGTDCQPAFDSCVKWKLIRFNLSLIRFTLGLFRTSQRNLSTTPTSCKASVIVVNRIDFDINFYHEYCIRNQLIYQTQYGIQPAICKRRNRLMVWPWEKTLIYCSVK